MQGALPSATVCALCCSPPGWCGVRPSNQDSASLSRDHSELSPGTDTVQPQHSPNCLQATDPPALGHNWKLSVLSKLKTTLLLRNEPKLENTCVGFCHPGEGESL